jgi:hypothetical protein
MFPGVAWLGLWLKRVLHCARRAFYRCTRSKSAAINVSRYYIFVNNCILQNREPCGRKCAFKQTKAKSVTRARVLVRVGAAIVNSTNVGRKLCFLLCVSHSNRRKAFWNFKVNFFYRKSSSELRNLSKMKNCGTTLTCTLRCWTKVN